MTLDRLGSRECIDPESVLFPDSMRNRDRGETDESPSVRRGLYTRGQPGDPVTKGVLPSSDDIEGPGV